MEHKRDTGGADSESYQTDGHSDGQTETQTDTQTDKQTDRHKRIEGTRWSIKEIQEVRTARDKAEDEKWEKRKIKEMRMKFRPDM